MRYHDFSFTIFKSGDTCRLMVLNSPAGESSGPIEMEVDLDGWKRIRDSMSSPRHLCGLSGKSIPDQHEALSELKNLGKELFNSLFPDSLRTLLDQSYGHQQNEHGRLRLKIHLSPADPDLVWLATMPWELLARPDARGPHFLALEQTSIVRYIQTPKPAKPRPFVKPLQVLLILSDPQGLMPLQIGREREEIDAALSQLDGVRVTTLRQPTRDRLRKALSEKRFDIVHFAGHGGWHQGGYGVLYLETTARQPDPVSGEWLSYLLQNLNTPRLVVLNACDTARESHRLAGVATLLVEAGAPAVVAMQSPISDHAAVTFSEALYGSLARETSIDTAVLEGRLAIFSQSEGSLEWAVPALFMRTPDGLLFPRQATESEQSRQRNHAVIECEEVKATGGGEIVAANDLSEGGSSVGSFGNTYDDKRLKVGKIEATGPGSRVIAANNFRKSANRSRQ